MQDHIIIFDTTLRDGEQAPGFNMNVQEKLRMAEQLERLNVDVIEAGFPIASEGDFIAVREIAKRARTCAIAGLSRTKEADIDRAWDALKYAKYPRIHTFIATSDLHLQYKLRKSRDEALKEAVWAVEYAKTLCTDVEFSAEDATRSDPEYLVDIFSAVIAAGADVINVPDTVGFSLPWEFSELISMLLERVEGIENVVLSVHCHDDLGNSVANSIGAVYSGARQVECTINGIGERAGNASLEEVVMSIKTRPKVFECDTKIDATEIYATSQLLQEITGVSVQPNKSVVGANAFAHEAGIHQDGVLKNPLTYEIMTPESVGVPGNKLVLGKHSGRNALNNRLQELGYELNRDQLQRVYMGFTRIADAKKAVLDQDIISLAEREVATSRSRKSDKVLAERLSEV
ncbi:2-isopropylmalate synthase [bacterium]|nr:2-isopropylmalate synthase [bacterium]